MQILSTYKPSPLQFVPSQIFFNQQKNLLKTFWFFPPTIIDLYVKYSFQLVEETYFIKWWECIAYDMDHNIQSQAMVYQVGLLSPKQMISGSWSLDLKDNTYRMKDGILSYIKNFPLRQWAWFVFLVCLLGLAGKFWEVLLYINIIGIGLMFLFSIWKTVQYLFGFWQKKNTTTTYKGFSVKYTQESDLQILSDELLNFLPNFAQCYIEKIAYTWNCFYFYQTLHKKSDNILSKDQELTDKEKAELTQRTIIFLQTSPFLSFVSQR